MKQSKGKKKNDRSIVRILFLGLFVLMICLAICLIHMADVKNIFETMKTEESRQKVLDAEAILDDHVDKTLDLLTQAAVLMTADKKALRDEDIFEIIQQYIQLDDFDNIYYVSDSAMLYKADGTMAQQKSMEIAHLLDMERANCFAHFQAQGGESLGVVYYVAPVFVRGKKVGQLVGSVSMDELLKRSAFEHLKELGDIYLVNESGLVYAMDADRYSFSGRDLFAYMRSSSADKYSDNRVLELKRKMEEETYQKTYIVDLDGMTDYIEVISVEGMSNVYLVYMYPETVVTDVINPVMYNSLVTCVVIIAIALCMLFYMWATSKKASDTIELLAYGDPITGGKNDNYFRNMAMDVIENNTSVPYLVARFDVANFRYINEAYGHVRADEILTIIIQESGKIFKDKEICTRMDSDQFVLLARNDQSFEAKFEEMMLVINDRAKEIGIMFPIRLKRGICPIRVEDNDIGIIIDHANAARKSLVGDEKVLVATYSEKIVQKMHVEEKIESEMADAMRNGEFKVFIQPKWDLVKDCICGGEALVRWVKPNGSMVFPDQFIPVFEKNGFIEKLDLYMLEEVCKKLRRLIDENRIIYPISVNQSRILLHNPDYINQVAKILKRHRIPNGFVELEITETVFLDERNLMIRTMNQLKSMDIKISMDDFGSGYSSLNMLKDVKFDVLKIDRGFFSEVITSQASVLILRKIIEMSEGLGIRVLCEGVETAEQVDMLKNLGCCYVQGYYYSKPIHCDEFAEKYCGENEGGKAYYDALYTEEMAERAIRDLKKNEATNTLSAHSSVEKFKKNYASKAYEVKSKTVIDENGKILSVEEQKIRAREAKNVKQTELSEDTGSDIE